MVESFVPVDGWTLDPLEVVVTQQELVATAQCMFLDCEEQTRRLTVIEGTDFPVPVFALTLCPTHDPQRWEGSQSIISSPGPHPSFPVLTLQSGLIV